MKVKANTQQHQLNNFNKNCNKKKRKKYYFRVNFKKSKNLEIIGRQ